MNKDSGVYSGGKIETGFLYCKESNEKNLPIGPSDTIRLNTFETIAKHHQFRIHQIIFQESHEIFELRFRNIEAPCLVISPIVAGLANYFMLPTPIVLSQLINFKISGPKCVLVVSCQRDT